MNGTEIRNQLTKVNMKQWELAQELGVSEATLIRWLRSEVTGEKQQKILQIIQNHGKAGEET